MPNACLRLALMLVLSLGVVPTLAAAVDERRFTVALETPALEVAPVEGGFARIELEGFRARMGSAGAPNLPVKKMLVAIPPDATPRLELTRAAAPQLLSVVPAPVVDPRGQVTGPSPSAGRLDDARSDLQAGHPDEAIYSGSGRYPEQLAWLGEIGVLRDQRYVELFIAPVRFDRDAGLVEIDARLELTVHFDGGAMPVGQPRIEPGFESVYRDTFVNYRQGRQFRLSAAGIDAMRQAISAEMLPSETVLAGTGPVQKLRIRDNGMVRLDFDYLTANAPALLAMPVADWRMTSAGVDVPFHDFQISGGAFDDTLIDRTGEYIQFYGQARDLDPTVILRDTNGPGGDELYAARDFTDENVYFLSISGGAAVTMTEREAAPNAAPDAGATFIDTAHAEIDDLFLPFADNDLYYWSPFVTEGSPTRTDSVDLPGLSSGTAPLTFRVNIRGASNCATAADDHMTSVRVDNALFQTLQLPASNPDNSGNLNIGVFDGNNPFTHAFDWTHSGGDPEAMSPLKFTLEAFNMPGACTDPPGGIRNDVMLNWIEVDYARDFAADGNTLTFGWDDGASVRFVIDGFTDPAIEVYEITDFVGGSDVLEPVRLTAVQVDEVPMGSGMHTVQFRMDDAGTGKRRRFVVTSGSAAAEPAPADFGADRASDLRTDTTHADLVVIAHPELLASTCSQSLGACETNSDCPGGLADTCELDPVSKLADYITMRTSQGLDVRLARIPDIEDEFNDGLPGPVAIEKFLAWVMAGGWQGSPPLYALLLGDGSYDFKGGTASYSFVPTELMTKAEDALGYYASDNLLAAVVGPDSQADLAVGRLPARTALQAEELLTKVIDYEDSVIPGAWQSNAVFVSDRSKNYADPNEGPMFESLNEGAISFLDGTPWTYDNLRYWSDYCPVNPMPGTCDIAGIKTDLRDAINTGASLLQFVGHGNFFVWSDDIMLCSDAGICTFNDFTLLSNIDALPFVLVHNCLSGGFHTLREESMGEQWLYDVDGGGIGVFAPSGLGFRFIGEDVIEEVWEDLFGPSKERTLGIPVMSSLTRLCGQGSIEACQYYTLLGDPSTTLQLPTVAPPTSPSAISSSELVEVSWTASATPMATYRVFRARFANGNIVAEANCPTTPYCPIGTTSGTTFNDTTARNGLSYVYTITALDPAGFESARSNFNSDCEPSPGPDCVLGEPFNPIAPGTPTGAVATDTENGGTLILTWDANVEGDLDYYTIHHGPTPALGSTRIIGSPGPQDTLTPGTMATFGGLTNNEPYYFALSATNTSGFTSPQSGIVDGTPSLVLGVKAPLPVNGLLLAKNGADAALTWTPVTEDIYGNGLTVTQYEVYRGDTAQFIPGPGNRIGTPVATSFDDVGELTGGQPDRFYLVRGLDLLGNPGGLGGQLPNGVLDLRLAKTMVVDHVSFSWSPVVTDFDGNPATVAYYELFASDEAFGRQAIEDGAIGQVGGPIAATSLELGPEPAVRFYSILAVDDRGNKSPF